MLRKEKYPIIEFDDCRDAVINPSHLRKEYDILPYNKLVITFFGEAIKMLLEEKKIEEYITISGENPVVLYKFADADVLITLGMVGCPACAGNLDVATGIGIDTVMFCGGGGVLDKTIEVGQLLVVEGAIRDEGFSYHYIEPSRIIYSQPDIRKSICAYLEENNVPYTQGLTWTTDAICRETRERVAARREEGARIVEMEQAGCLAVAQFRGIKYGGIIYAGDDVSGDDWDQRSWRSRKGIRYSLVEISKELVQII
ncbi:MAG: nucleoside phosphorylase [Clostridia bacterium]|nr:nucleoside phosphorylase [Clostridia bacterium]